MIFLIAIISFLLGFCVYLVSFPYILVYVVQGGWKYVKKVGSSSVFRWSVSLIVSFAVSAWIIQEKRARVVKECQRTVDSLRWELRMLQQNNEVR